MNPDEMCLYRLCHRIIIGGAERKYYSWVIARNPGLVSKHIQGLLAALQSAEGVQDHISFERIGALNGVQIACLIFLLGDDQVPMLRTKEEEAYWQGKRA